MRIVCFNVNGIRARLHQLAQVAEAHSPEVIAVQESKVVDDDFPHEAIAEIGYSHCYVYGQKGHYGVALLSKRPLTDVQLGFPWRPADQQRRFIAARMSVGRKAVHLINGYFPQGEARSHATKFPAKAEYYADLLRYLGEHRKPADRVLVVGDMNVAPEDQDIGIGEDNKKRWLRTGKSSFLPEEREWLTAVCNWGLRDTYAIQNPEQRDYSWFDYRSRGFEREPKRGLRIDLILATEPLMGCLTGTGIDHAIRSAERPSDHCPIWADFEL